MRIAIVGAGISGLTAAYLVNREHEVDLYEQADYAGGHANTISIDAGDREVALDTGFIVYNENTYPGFTKLLRTLGVRTKPGDMSLSVRCDACNIEYSSRGLRGFLAQRSNMVRPARAALAFDIFRFYRDTRRSIDASAPDRVALDEYVREKRYSGEFVRHFLIPLAAAVWSTPQDKVGDFPAQYFLRFLHNHGIIGLQPAFVWRTVEGGSKRYVEAMTEPFADRVRLHAPVRQVTREAGGARLVLDGGREERYDRVVLATHADQALNMLGDASVEERTALSVFRYTANTANLHTDRQMLPEIPSARASWNYRTADCRAPGQALGMTYHLNRLQALDEPVDYCVTLNARPARPDTIIAEMTYEHPSYTFDTLDGQRAIEALQGQRGTYFAGAHLGYGFHEDGLQSGVRVARRFGIEL
jgi:predicted NAD/FAD-binding protein